MELYEHIIKLCKQINGETSSLILVEDLASHDIERQNVLHRNHNKNEYLQVMKPKIEV